MPEKLRDRVGCRVRRYLRIDQSREVERVEAFLDSRLDNRNENRELKNMAGKVACEKENVKEWIREGIVKRKSQFSTVIIYKTRDPKRLPEYIKSVYSNFSEIYAYYVWRGLQKVRVEGGRIVFEKALSSARSLEAALDHVDGLFLRKERILFVIQAYRASDALTQALRAWMFDESMYAKGHTITIFTEEPASVLDDATIKYAILIKIPPSTREEREQILLEIARATNSEVDKSMIDATSGLTLQEVESVALESVFRFGRLDTNVLLNYKYDIIRKAGVLDVEESEHGFDAIGGYDVVKEFIIDNVVKVLQNPRKAERLGIRPPKGLLLFGPPGTGKTLFARAMAKELNLPFLRLRTENIVSRWYGESEKNLAKAIELAEEVAPCILFVDEIDRFGRRGESDHETSRRMFSVLLEWLGDARRKTIMLGTTNKPHYLDEAFIRVGRFDYIIPVLLPDFEARKQILEVHTRVVRKVPLKDVSLEDIAEKTELFTGAELEELVLRAARNALREDREFVTQEDFEISLESFSIDWDERRRQMDEYMELSRKYCNDLRFLNRLTNTMSSRIEALKRQLEGT